jgi:lactate racemase
MHGQGSATHLLDDATAGDLLGAACAEVPLDGKRVLVLIPDGTRNARFRSCFDCCMNTSARASRGWSESPPRIGPSATRKVNIFNHAWDRADALTTIGSISAPEVETLTGGLLCEPIPVTLNRMILDYDQLIINFERATRSGSFGGSSLPRKCRQRGRCRLFHGRWRVVGPMDSSG